MSDYKVYGVTFRYVRAESHEKAEEIMRENGYGHPNAQLFELPKGHEPDLTQRVKNAD